MPSSVSKIVGYACALVLICGCGSSGPETAEVEGIVRLDDQPLTLGIVTFTPKGGRSATGFIQKDGTFRLTTYQNGDGALVGKHTVTITPGGSSPQARPDFESDRPTLTTNSPIPVKYGVPGTSGLEFEVKPGEANYAEFSLSSK
jgi:hypothetical protein